MWGRDTCSRGTRRDWEKEKKDEMKMTKKKKVKVYIPGRRDPRTRVLPIRGKEKTGGELCFTTKFV